MITSPRIIRKSTKLIDGAIQRTVSNLRSGRIQQETDFTSRMLQNIENEMDGVKIRDVVWEATVLIGRSQENRFGADFLGVLKIDLPHFVVRKGFLAQAKLIRRRSFPSSERRRLQQQCDDMLSVTPDSFVFLYSQSGVKIVPAISAWSSNGDLSKLYKMNPARFFELHLESFIGDRRLSVTDAKSLEGLRQDYDVEAALMLGARLAR